MPLNVAMAAGMRRREISVSGRRTSVTLEQGLWDLLDEVCDREDLTPSQLYTLVDGRNAPGGALAQALRGFSLCYAELMGEAAPQAGPAGMAEGAGRSYAASLLDRALDRFALGRSG